MGHANRHGSVACLNTCRYHMTSRIRSDHLYLAAVRSSSGVAEAKGEELFCTIDTRRLQPMLHDLAPPKGNRKLRLPFVSLSLHILNTCIIIWQKGQYRSKNKRPLSLQINLHAIWSYSEISQETPNTTPCNVCPSQRMTCEDWDMQVSNHSTRQAFWKPFNYNACTLNLLTLCITADSHEASEWHPGWGGRLYFDNSAWQRSLHAWFQGVNLLNTAPFKDLHQSIVVKPEWLSKAAFKESTSMKVK